MEDLMRSQQVENILEVAGDLFLEFGFVNTRVSDIAARSEISTASIYKAFRLLSAFIEHQTIWYGLFISATARKSVEKVRIADEAVRIVLAAYPSKIGEAFDLSDVVVQSA